MSGRPLQRVLLFVALWVSVAYCRTAWAEEPTAAEVQVARRLFQRATADEELGRWESALKTLREVESIKVTPGVLFHIAVCEQNLERYVAALNDLGRAEELAQIKADESVLELVPARRQQIEAMVGHLRVVLAGATEKAEVRVDGAVVSPAALRLDIPLDPHEHTVSVLRSNRPTLRRKVTLTAGSRQTERFDLTAAVANAEYATGDLPLEDQHDPNLTKRVVTYSAFALAVAGTGMGIYFLIDASASERTAKLARADVARAVDSIEQQGITLPRAPCSTPYQSINQSRDLADACVELYGAVDHKNRSRTLSVWSFAIAGVGALGGTATLLFWPEHAPKVSLNLAPGIAGANLRGTF